MTRKDNIIWLHFFLQGNLCEYKREGERFRLSCLLADREAGVDTLGNCFLYPGGLSLNEPEFTMTCTLREWRVYTCTNRSMDQ